MLKLARFLKPYRLMVVVVVVLAFLQALTQLYLPTLMAEIVDVGIVQADVGFIVRTGAWMLVVTLGGMSAMAIASYFGARAGTGYARDIRSAIFRHVEGFSLHEFDRLGTASLITRTTNDVTQVQQVTVMILRLMIMAPIMAIGGIIMSVSKDAKLSLVFLVVLPILTGIIILVASKAIPLFQAMQKKIDRINLVLRERLSGIRVIRALNRTEHEEKRFESANRDLMQTAMKVNMIMVMVMPIMMIMMNVTSVVLIWFGAIRIDRGSMQVGDMMAFIQYAMQIMFSLLMATMMFVMIPRGSASAKRINEVLEVAPEIRDPAQPKSTGEGRGHVEFRDVTFTYPGAEEPAVRNVSFAAAPGEITAIIGGTGAGKSTLVNLIPRFYDVDSGTILVDGVDVRELTQESLRSKIGYVPQKAVLFSGTIDENIRFGRKDASAEEISAAIATAQSADFVEAMEGGVEAIVAQDGTNLSGGQKQRLSIARALVRKPGIYIFDDTFSALDFRTDARLRAALRSEIARSTVFIVAQRVATIMRADRIVVLDEGAVCGIGTHAELMENCDVYRQIVLSQLSLEEIA
jgi:ATP-binding cassette, subfamily B, multidrug efflux pump